MKKVIIVTTALLLAAGCATRPVTPEEKKGLDYEYQGKLKTQKIEVTKHKVEDNETFQLQQAKYAPIVESSEQNNDRPFVMDETIFYPKSLYKDNFAEFDIFGLPDWALFVHENCHIWQYQTGMRSKKHGNRKYHWTIGAYEQVLRTFGTDVYTPPAPNEIKPDADLSDFYFEQQCSIIERYASVLPEQRDLYVKEYGDLIKKALARKEAGNEAKSEAKSEAQKQQEGTLVSEPLAAQEVTFRFFHVGKKEFFTASTSDVAVIETVRAELAKPFKERSKHINGPIEKSQYRNEAWSWSFIDSQWQLADNSMELCDAWPQYVEDNLDEWMEQVGSFCPWSARVIDEVQ